MKRIPVALFLTMAVSTGLFAQKYNLSAEPVRDSVVIEYYFCFASTWDDTTFFTNIFYRYQDTLSKKGILEKDWDKYIKQDMRLKKYKGFVKGPYYDSVFAGINREKWIKERPDTIPLKEIHYVAGPEEKPVRRQGLRVAQTKK
ncbi:MAG: hypothetical protein PVF73_02030 [Bacteroidales bacterium]|jgi:hypothetical protein